MAVKSVLEFLKRILLSLRRNWGLKLVSLLFAVILWNYVIGEVDPVHTVTFTKIPVTFSETGKTLLENANFTVKGALPDKTVDVTLEMKRSEAALINKDQISAVVDLGGITSAGEKKLKIRITVPRGTVTSPQPEITVEIEKKEKLPVPVVAEAEGELPQGLWRGDFKLNVSQVEVSGASSLVKKVASARIVVQQAELTASGSSARPIELVDEDGNVLQDVGGLTITPSSCIVNYDVYPTKTVRIDGENSINGKTAKGYEIKDVSVDPQEIIIAGPQDLLATIESLATEPVDVGGRDSDVSISRRVVLPTGIHAVGVDTVQVHVFISEKMTAVTLEDLPVHVENLADNLVLETRDMLATVTVTCPELLADRIKKSSIRLTVDAEGLADRAYTLPITPEYDAELGVDSILIEPASIMVKFALKAVE